MKNPLEISSCCCDTSHSLSVEAARESVLAHATPITCIETIPLLEGLGRVLATHIVSPINVPAHINAAMDGYAVLAADLPTQGSQTLQIVGTSLAGKPYPHPIQHGECVRIMTGAAMPIGADTVIMQEYVTVQANTICFMAGEIAGQHVRHIGENLAQSETALHAGTCLMPAELGLLASLGITQISVQRPLRVAYFSTGDELCHPGEALEWGKIYDSNRYTLYGMLQRLGVIPIDLGIVPDNIASLEKAFQTASQQADVIISSGGVSVGESDFTKHMIARLGKIHFWRVAMKPGKPLTFGTLNNCLFFGLPGNPVATMVSFYQFVQPALLKMMHRPYAPLLLTATVAHTIKKNVGRTEFLRGILTSTAPGAWSVHTCEQQGSAILRSMNEANCFVILPADQKIVEQGMNVTVQPFVGLV